MKIKKIIYLYLFALSLTLLGSEISDEEMEKAIEESLKDQHADPLVNEQNSTYSLLELENKLEGLRKILEEKAYIMFFDLNTKIKSAKEEEKDIDKFNSIRERIKKIMYIIPHEVLESEKIYVLDSFTMMWGGIQREEKERVDDPLESREEKIIKEATISKIKKTESDIKIYNRALKRVDRYIKENNLKEDQIIKEKEERRRKEKEQADKETQEIKNKLAQEREEKEKQLETQELLKKVVKFKEEEQKIKRIERENDPQLKEIQKIRDIIYKKVSDYFNAKNVETALTEAKKKYYEETIYEETIYEETINNIKQKIELIMKYCPHEFFTEEKIQNTFPEIKKIFQQAQQQHSTESKIFNPTENNKEDLEHWKNTLKKLNIHITIDSQVNTDKINKINKRLLNNLQTQSFNRLRENSILEKTKHLKTGIGIGLLTSLGIIGLHNNFLKQSSRKKMDLLQKSLILSGSTILGGIGGKYFYQMKKYIPQN